METSHLSRRRRRSRDGALDTLRFLAPCALIDQNPGTRPGYAAEEPLFEGICDALGEVIADAEAHGDERPCGNFDGVSGSDVRRCALDAESFVCPARREYGQGVIAITAVCAAFEKEVILLRAYRQKPELRQARIGINDDALREREQWQQQ